MATPRNFVGRCIYCDSTVGLTREHIIPQGIGGRSIPDGFHEAMVLRDASCEACTKITKELEGRILGAMMGIYRAKAGMRHKDRRRDTHTITVEKPGGDTFQQEVDVERLPSAMLFPVFGQPGVLAGRAIGEPPITSYLIALEGKWEQGIQGEKIPGTVKIAKAMPSDFGRLLAKIALGHAVSEYGIDGFKPLVRGFILGNRDEFGHWLGGPLGQPLEEPDDVLHQLSISYFAAEGLPTYIAVEVRLFANLGGPRNYVIVGETGKAFR